MKILLFLTILMFGTSPLFGAGGWNSGGGHYLNDRLNPWFLTNIKEVKYCIDLDTAHFGVGEERALVSIREAIAFWKREFPRLSLDGEMPGVLKVATQQFVKIDECEVADLRFQMGVLGERQKREDLPNYKQFAAATIRESYDRKIMKGKGYVYVSPETGPLKLNGDPIPNRWSIDNSKRLTFMLIHELGHVFGLTYTESLHGRLVMDPDIANILLEGEGEQGFSYHFSSPLFRKTEGNTYSVCFDQSSEDDVWMYEFLLEFIPIFSGYSCLKIVIPAGAADNEQNMEVFFSQKVGEAYELIGQVIVKNSQTDLTPNNLTRVFVPESVSAEEFSSLERGKSYAMYSDTDLMYSHSGVFSGVHRGENFSFPLKVKPLFLPGFAIRLSGLHLKDRYMMDFAYLMNSQ